MKKPPKSLPPYLLCLCGCRRQIPRTQTKQRFYLAECVQPKEKARG